VREKRGRGVGEEDWGCSDTINNQNYQWKGAGRRKRRGDEKEVITAHKGGGGEKLKID